MNHYVIPSSDIFIKYLFGSEENKDLLLSFINANLSEIGFDKIIEVEVKNPFNVKTFIVEKETILDVKATDEKGRIYNIEVQSRGNTFFINRSLYYWSKLYNSQIIEKEPFALLKPTICINVLDFKIFDKIDDFFSCYLIKEKTTNEILTDHLVLIFAELPKITQPANHEKIYNWLYYLKNEGGNDKMLETLLKEDEALKKAHNQYVKFTNSSELLELYEARKKYELTYISELDEAEKKGEIKGKIEGKLEGKYEFARNLKKDGFTKKQISKYTGLTEEEIDKL